MATKPGLYANINAKQDRIKAGSGEKMNKVGSKAAPSKQDFIHQGRGQGWQAGETGRGNCLFC